MTSQAARPFICIFLLTMTTTMEDALTVEERARDFCKDFFADATGRVTAADRARTLKEQAPDIWLKARSRVRRSATRNPLRVFGRARQEYVRRFRIQQREEKTGANVLAEQLSAIDLSNNVSTGPVQANPVRIVPPESSHTVLSRIFASYPPHSSLDVVFDPTTVREVYMIARLQQLLPPQSDLELDMQRYFALGGIEAPAALMGFFV
uniref:Uncharacterized protein n=1 Tax=Mycena chlorophos TaxID=658473 RepID=A0ABQ0KZX5_MYCCL|nr:predicted protein [Mycena chlorophos]